MTVVHIPALLREFTGGKDEVEIEIPPQEPVSVRTLVEELERRHPGITSRLLAEGQLVPGIAVFVNGEQADLGLLEKVSGEDQVYFIPPIAGG